MAGGAHHEEDLPLVEQDLVPPLHMRLAQGSKAVPASMHKPYWGERATKLER